MPYDLVIKGGSVLDPGQGIDGTVDIGIEGSTITAIGADLPIEGAGTVLDAGRPGRYVVPGLIDIHTHVAHGATTPGLGMLCCDPDSIGVESGVTTVVDCGSVGVANIGVFPVHIVPRAATRTICFANAACFAHTMPGMSDMRSVDDLDIDAMRLCVEHNPGLVEGIKLRLVGTPAAEHGEELIRRSVAMAAEHGVPLMTHIGDFGRDDPEHRVRMAQLTMHLLDQMRPGDILTHLCTPNPGGVLDAAGQVLPTLQAARDRGVVLDPALGRGNFGYAVAAELAQRGFHPDTISSDLTAYGYDFHSLLECMAKFMAIGYTLSDVVRMTTASAAHAIGRADTLGALAVGREADVSIIDVVEGDFRFEDTRGDTFLGRHGLVPVHTVRAGRLHAPRWGTHPWGWLPAPAES
ncbi:amidohydrolase family protein [Desertimonas flava]|uniref:amidohydrolase family protein n=1 Tax=Desertimonas flava TaxID=2064846 RepID=UPI0013C471E0|nr:amidohydrolase family protein [Desertimonas flava]